MVFPISYPIRKKTIKTNDLELTPRDFIKKMVQSSFLSHLTNDQKAELCPPKVHLALLFNDSQISHPSFLRFKKECSFPKFPDDVALNTYIDVINLTKHIEFCVTGEITHLSGQMVVRIIEAKDLAAADSNGLSDPYCVVTRGKYKKKTKIKYKNLNPYWDEEFSFELEGTNKEDLTIEVYDKDSFGTDDFLGRVNLPIEFIITNLGDLWLKLEPKPAKNHDKFKIQGNIHLHLSVKRSDQKSTNSTPSQQHRFSFRPRQGTISSSSPTDTEKETIRAFEIISEGNLELFKKALQNLSLRAVNPYHQETFLHAAVREGQNEIARYLINKKINISAKDNDDFTPLHYAIISNNHEMAMLLINKNAQINVENKEGSTPLIYAARAFPNDVSSYLQVMELLLRRNADINHTPHATKDTALHHSAIMERTLGVHYLLERNAKPNPINSTGHTPLHIACINGNASIVLSLLDHGADPSIKTKELGTCIEVAEKRSNNPDVIQLLLSWSNKNRSETIMAFYSLLDDIIATLKDFDHLFNNKQLASFTSNSNLEMTYSSTTIEPQRLNHLIEFDSQASKPDPSSDFKLEKQLGEGAYGQVYRGVHKQLGFPVAIKVIPVTEKTKNKLQNEIKIQLLSRHNNIVHCYDIYYTGEKVCIVMELCGHGSVLDLQDKLNRDFTEAEICAFVECILKGLSHLHSNSIIHRDLKCQNLLITLEGKLKLADFGVSSQLDKDQQARTVIGTPLFMSPEVLLAQPYGASADIWSLGITILQLASELPYQGLAPVVAIFKIITEPPPTLSDSPRFSQLLHKFIGSCLQVDPLARPSSDKLLEDDFITLASQASEKVLFTLVSEIQPEDDKSSRSS